MKGIEVKQAELYHKIAKCMDAWMGLREQEYSIGNYFQLHNIHKVGIYGYGILGRHLVWEIEQMNESVEIEWILDKRAESITNVKIPIYLPDLVDTISDVDVIIVCAIGDFAEIEAMLCQKTSVKVIPLDEIVRYCVNRLRKVQ